MNSCYIEIIHWDPEEIQYEAEHNQQIAGQVARNILNLPKANPDAIVDFKPDLDLDQDFPSVNPDTLVVCGGAFTQVDAQFCDEPYCVDQRANFLMELGGFKAVVIDCSLAVPVDAQLSFEQDFNVFIV
jgi:hypothetical protein